MMMFDLMAFMFIGMSHVLFYLYFIQYKYVSKTFVILTTVFFTILLVKVINETGYPVLNLILLLLFLLSLGLMKKGLKFHQSLFSALLSSVIITYAKMVLLDVAIWVFMYSPFNLYIWTGSVIHLIVCIVIFGIIVLLRKQIQQFGTYMVDSPLYYVSYVLVAFGVIVGVILSVQTTKVLATLNQQYGYASYIAAIVLFLALLIILLISWNMTKAKMIEEQQEQFDRELLEYVKKLEIMHEELSTFRHDYMNILLALNEGVRAKDISQIEQIYHTVIAPTLEPLNHHELDLVKLARIDIPEVKSVLVMKVITAQHQQVRVMLDIPHTITEIPMSKIMFIRAITILVDNAIEEAICSKEREVQIAFFENEANLYFVVRNRYDRKIDLQRLYEKGYSKKEGNRGYGLYSLKKMIDKTANVTLETTISERYFTQTFVVKKVNEHQKIC